VVDTTTGEPGVAEPASSVAWVATVDGIGPPAVAPSVEDGVGWASRLGSQASAAVWHESGAEHAVAAKLMSWSRREGPPVEKSDSSATKHWTTRQSAAPNDVVITAGVWITTAATPAASMVTTALCWGSQASSADWPLPSRVKAVGSHWTTA
jgi:hypothetical protein